MADKVIPIVSHASATAAHWSPLDALRECIRQIENNEINPEQLVIHYQQPNAETGGKKHNFFAAGVGYPEHIAILHIALACVTDDWRGL